MLSTARGTVVIQLQTELRCPRVRAIVIIFFFTGGTLSYYAQVAVRLTDTGTERAPGGRGGGDRRRYYIVYDGARQRNALPTRVPHTHTRTPTFSARPLSVTRVPAVYINSSYLVIRAFIYGWWVYAVTRGIPELPRFSSPHNTRP